MDTTENLFRSAKELLAKYKRHYQLAETTAQLLSWKSDSSSNPDLVHRMIEEFGKQMQTRRFKTYMGRGIAFFNMQNRMKVKGSDLGKDYSLQNLEKRLGMEISQAFVPVKKKKKSRRKQQGLSI